ncbi:MAG: tetratricopeptide repeat protein [Terriglobia bacterium]
MGKPESTRTDAYASRLLWGLLIVVPFATAQTTAPEQLYKEAEAAYQRGDLRRAIALYEELVKLQPDSVPLRTDFGVALARAGRYGEAVTQYREALKRDPANATVRLNLALAWYKQAAFVKAAAELEGFRKQQPDNKQSLHLLADCYLRLGRNRDAVTLLEPAYKADPDDRAVAYALGIALIRNGQVQKGEAVIDHILKHGDTAEAKFLMGAAQYAAGDFRAAVATLRAAVDLEPQLPGVWTVYARALLDSGDNEGAKAAFKRALANDPNDFEANLYLGGVLRTGGKYSEAGPYVGRAAQLRPDSPEARFQVGALDLALGHLEEARKELERVAREWPDFQEVHVQLAVLYARLNRMEDSRRERELVVKLNEKARNPQAPPP